MQYKKRILMLLASVLFQLKCEPQEPPVFNININNNNEQHSSVQVNQSYAWDELYGQQLKECLESYPAEERKKIFLSLSQAKRAQVMSLYTIHEYYQFLDDYQDNEEWKQFREQLPKDEQNRWSQSLSNEKRLVVQFYYFRAYPQKITLKIFSEWLPAFEIAKTKPLTHKEINQSFQHYIKRRFKC